MVSELTRSENRQREMGSPEKMGRKKRVLDVGQCPPDHLAIRMLMENLGAEVHQVALPAEAMRILTRQSFDLVLVNRKIDRDYTDGIELVRMMQKSVETRGVPVILISNFPEAQQEAVQAGARQGFGKDHLQNQDTLDLLRQYLS